MTRVRVSCALAITVAGCGATPSAQSSTPADGSPAAIAVHTSGSDWTRFGWDAARSNVSTASTGITAGNAGLLRRQQLQLDGIVDSSPIYLSAVTVNGATHDVFFVTTIYGKTLAIDADEGTVLWSYAPPAYSSWAGSYQITTATPVSDPDRQSIYAASPDGHVQKLAVADGHLLWSTAISMLPQREKIAAALNYANGRQAARTAVVFRRKRSSCSRQSPARARRRRRA